jgi:nucleoid DNA-binding protein
MARSRKKPVDSDLIDAALWREARAMIRETRGTDAKLQISGFGTLAIRAGDGGDIVVFRPYQSLSLGIEAEAPPKRFESPDLVERIARATGCDRRTATDRLSFHVRRTVLAAADRVRPRSVPLGDLGMLLLHHLPGHVDRNPRTGDTFHVPGQRRPFFYGARSLLVPEGAIPEASGIVEAAIAAWERPPVSFAEIEPDLAAIELPAFVPSSAEEGEAVAEIAADLHPDRLLGPPHEAQLAVFLEGSPRVEWFVEDAAARHPVGLEAFIRATAVAVTLRRHGPRRITAHDASRIIDHVVDRAPPDAWMVLAAVLVPSIRL